MIQIPNISAEFYKASLPICVLLFAATALMVMSVFRSTARTRVCLYTAEVSIVTALLLTLWQITSQPSTGQSFLNATFVVNHLSLYGSMLILLIGFVVTVLMKEHFLRSQFFRGEVASIFLFSLAGMLIMVATDDMITMFLGLELASIAIYALVGYVHPGRLSLEGAMKYFVLGSAAAAVLLFGFAFLYAATGTMQITAALQSLAKMGDHPWARVGLVLLVSGFGFKLALVPFHLWSPDAYEAAPSGVTAFMSTAVKVMIMVSMLRFLPSIMAQPSALAQIMVAALAFFAVLSVLFANIMALVQVSMRRLLAYSSIAHSGYMAIALAALSNAGSELALVSILSYLFVYAAITLGFFAILMWLESETIPNLTVEDFNGLAKRHPVAAFALAVFLFSLGGMPPSALFITKFVIFNAAVKSHLVGIVIVAAVGSTISLYYYLRLIVRMYMSESNVQLPAPKRSWRIVSVVVACVLLNLLIGTVLPSATLRMAKSVAADALPG